MLPQQSKRVLAGGRPALSTAEVTRQEVSNLHAAAAAAAPGKPTCQVTIVTQQDTRQYSWRQYSYTRQAVALSAATTFQQQTWIDLPAAAAFAVTAVMTVHVTWQHTLD
jgi:hypothetical protein